MPDEATPTDAPKPKKPRTKKATADVPPADPAAPPVAAKKTRKKQPTAAELLVVWVHNREVGKQHYEAADAALQAMLKKVKPGKTVTHPVTSEVFTMTDNFAEKNTVFGLAGVKRFELKPVKGTKKTPTAVPAAPPADAPAPEAVESPAA